MTVRDPLQCPRAGTSDLESVPLPALDRRASGHAEYGALVVWSARTPLWYRWTIGAVDSVCSRLFNPAIRNRNGSTA
ncbi:hypothetical protein HBB16_08000, partial [Pseudonocardia sp. MCCB 268]|nr:hypothetical protein [Pseudonocardia cytotoxica]